MVSIPPLENNGSRVSSSLWEIDKVVVLFGSACRWVDMVSYVGVKGGKRGDGTDVAGVIFITQTKGVWGATGIVLSLSMQGQIYTGDRHSNMSLSARKTQTCLPSMGQKGFQSKTLHTFKDLG